MRLCILFCFKKKNAHGRLRVFNFRITGQSALSRGAFQPPDCAAQREIRLRAHPMVLAGRRRRVYGLRAAVLSGLSKKRRALAVAPAPAAASIVSSEAAPPTAPSSKPAADSSGAAESEGVALQRMLAKPDGRCQIRAVLYAAAARLPDGVGDILSSDTEAARKFIASAREAAAMKVVDLCFEDASFGELCRSTFPDEAYASLDEWVEAMASDDTGDDISSLWLGGGQWLLHGLALAHNLQIYVASWYADGYGGHIKRAPQPINASGGRRINLCMLHDDEGMPDHFDALVTADFQAAHAPTPVVPSLPPSPPPSECAADETTSLDGCLSAEEERPRDRRCRGKACVSSCPPSLATLMAEASLEEAPDGDDAGSLTVITL